MEQSHFRFNKQERSGIFFLLLIILMLQGAYYFISSRPSKTNELLVLNESEQAQLDSLRNSIALHSEKIFPFNPNYINDYKGYQLGLTIEQLDRLQKYRSAGSFVNSAAEFQLVTQISDSLLQVLAPYFKFPEWNKRNSSANYKSEIKPSSKNVEVLDLNTASAADFMQISGIGPTLSARIVKFRDRLGGFLVEEQLYDVYGLDAEVVKRTLERFQVKTVPKVEKIAINSASAEELAKLVYINFDLAREIVAYRNLNGPFSDLDDLSNVTSFPEERFERIKLYLTL